MDEMVPEEPVSWPFTLRCCLSSSGKAIIDLEPGGVACCCNVVYATRSSLAIWKEELWPFGSAFTKATDEFRCKEEVAEVQTQITT